MKYNMLFLNHQYDPNRKASIKSIISSETTFTKKYNAALVIKISPIDVNNQESIAITQYIM